MTSKPSMGVVLWFTGLPSSGKSTLAARVRDSLMAAGFMSVMLDGDKVRRCLVPKPGYSDLERDAFYATIGHLAAMLAEQGHVVLVPATASKRHYREDVRERVSAFIEVFLDVPLAEAMRRDETKGLYAQARAGGRATLPGLGTPYEPPLTPDVVASGGEDEVALAEVVRLVLVRTSEPDAGQK